ncbi:MAG: hypothetical protein R3B96_09610 [Pirellulaceae bacterium]
MSQLRELPIWLSHESGLVAIGAIVFYLTLSFFLVLVVAEHLVYFWFLPQWRSGQPGSGGSFLLALVMLMFSVVWIHVGGPDPSLIPLMAAVVGLVGSVLLLLASQWVVWDWWSGSRSRIATSGATRQHNPTHLIESSRLAVLGFPVSLAVLSVLLVALSEVPSLRHPLDVAQAGNRGDMKRILTVGMSGTPAQSEYHLVLALATEMDQTVRIEPETRDLMSRVAQAQVKDKENPFRLRFVAAQLLTRMDHSRDWLKIAFAPEESLSPAGVNSGSPFNNRTIVQPEELRGDEEMIEVLRDRCLLSGEPLLLDQVSLFLSAASEEDARRFIERWRANEISFSRRHAGELTTLPNGQRIDSLTFPYGISRPNKKLIVGFLLEQALQGVHHPDAYLTPLAERKVFDWDDLIEWDADYPERIANRIAFDSRWLSLMTTLRNRGSVTRSSIGSARKRAASGSLPISPWSVAVEPFARNLERTLSYPGVVRTACVARGEMPAGDD